MPRPSPVRDIIQALIASESRHAWSLDELVDGVRARAGAADYSTVFRSMVALEARGQVRRLDLGDGKSRFERAEAHHEHISCISCGRVAEVSGCLVDDAAASVEAETGFRVAGHTLVFSGLCASCAAAGEG